MIRAALISLTAVISGCVTQPSAPPSAEAMRPLICKDKVQCDLYWARAQGWVASNSTYRIQTVSDTIIVTYGPFGRKSDLAYQVVRVPNADGSARLTIRAACDNYAGCAPSPAEAAVLFKRYVQASG